MTRAETRAQREFALLRQCECGTCLNSQALEKNGRSIWRRTLERLACKWSFDQPFRQYRWVCLGNYQQGGHERHVGSVTSSSRRDGTARPKIRGDESWSSIRFTPSTPSIYTKETTRHIEGSICISYAIYTTRRIGSENRKHREPDQGDRQRNRKVAFIPRS